MSSAPGYGAYLHFESHQVAAARSVQMASYKSSSFACFIMATAAAAVCVSKRDHFKTRYYLLRCSLALGRFPLTLNFLGIRLLNNKFHGLSPSALVVNHSLLFDQGFQNNVWLQRHLVSQNAIWWYFVSMRLCQSTFTFQKTIWCGGC